jgi:predicted XRE-type DNA-binding protein
MSKSEDIEVVPGSGNVFRDLKFPNAETHQLRAQLAAEIIGIIRGRKLSQRAAADLTGLTQADVSHIKNAKLRGFTIDRLVCVLSKLDRHVEMRVVRTTRKRARRPA